MSLTTQAKTDDGLICVTHESTMREFSTNAMQLEPAIRAFGQEHGAEETMAMLAFWLGSYLGASGAVVDFGNPPKGGVPALVKTFYDAIRKIEAH